MDFNGKLHHCLLGRRLYHSEYSFTAWTTDELEGARGTDIGQAGRQEI